MVQDGRGGGLRRERRASNGYQIHDGLLNDAGCQLTEAMSAGSAGSMARSTGTWPRREGRGLITLRGDLVRARPRCARRASHRRRPQRPPAFALREAGGLRPGSVRRHGSADSDPDRSRSARRGWRRGSVLVGVRPVIGNRRPRRDRDAGADRLRTPPHRAVPGPPVSRAQRRRRGEGPGQRNDRLSPRRRGWPLDRLVLGVLRIPRRLGCAVPDTYPQRQRSVGRRRLDSPRLGGLSDFGRLVVGR